MILPPMLNKPYDDRNTDCEMAIETEIHQIIDKAVAVGWERKEVMTAIANVVLNEMFAQQENEQSNFRLSQALGKVEH